MNPPHPEPTNAPPPTPKSKIENRKSRIVLVGPTHPFRGGISHYTTLLCRHLRERHNVRFFTFRRQYPAWLFPGRSDQDDSQAPLRVEADPCLNGLNPLTWWQVAQTIRQNPPSLLILQWTVSYWIPLLWLLLRCAPPATRTVLICHNATPHEQEHPILAPLRRYLQRRVMAQADHLICHATSDEQTLRTLLPNTPIHRLMHPTYADLAPIFDFRFSIFDSQLPPDPSPPTTYSPILNTTVSPLNTQSKIENRKSKIENRKSPSLLFFGFVRPYKGIETLFRAMPRVLRALPDAQLTVAGEWWKDAIPARRALDPTLGDAITILDRYIPNEELAPLFAAADVVVLPYHSATQSGVVQLAYGFGLPVITTTVGGLPEAVQHEVTGLLVPPNDPDALADAIIRYHQEGWRSRLAPGVAAARDRFSWAALVDLLERLSLEP